DACCSLKPFSSIVLNFFIESVALFVEATIIPFLAVTDSASVTSLGKSFVTLYEYFLVCAKLGGSRITISKICIILRDYSYYYNTNNTIIVTHMLTFLFTYYSF